MYVAKAASSRFSLMIRMFSSLSVLCAGFEIGSAM